MKFKKNVGTITLVDETHQQEPWKKTYLPDKKNAPIKEELIENCAKNIKEKFLKNK